MIIVPGEYILLATPRTGSRALVDAFLAADVGAVVGYGHHTWPDEYSEYQRTIPRRLDTYTMLREPFAQWVSWYTHSRMYKTMDFLTFTKTWTNQFINDDAAKYPEEGLRSSMNIYKDMVDEFFLYEDGLDAVVSSLTGNGNILIPKLGGTQAHKVDADQLWSIPEVPSAFITRFKQDVVLYKTEFERRLGK